VASEPLPAPENPSLLGRRLQAYDAAVSLIREESFAEALAYVRRLPRDLRDWVGLASLEAALVSPQDPQEAYRLYDKILNAKERSAHWARALVGYRSLLKGLAERGDFPARLRLVKCLVFEWRNREARDLLAETLLDEALPAATRSELESLAAALAIRVGDFAAAEAYFEGKSDRASLRWLSTLHARQGNFALAASFRERAAESLKGPNRLREYARVLDLLAKGGHFAEAEALLAKIPELKDKVPSWPYYLGVSAMVAGDWAKALDYFEPETRYPRERGQRALYFKGRALELLNRQPEAAEAYALTLKGPFNYYQLLSQGRYLYLHAEKSQDLPLAPLFVALLATPTGEDSDSVGYFLWLREKLPFPFPEESAPFTPRGGPGDAARARQSAFHYAALGGRARAALEIVQGPEGVFALGAKGEVTEEAARLILTLARAQEYDKATRFLSLIKAPGPQATAPIPAPNLARPSKSDHPLVYARDAREAYARYGLAPQLLLSVIRTESFFQKDAVSVSNARGLTQILPSTAAGVALLRGEEIPRDEALFDPTLNIAYGAYYLSKLLESFQSTPLALAAYNGGPYNMESLLRGRPPLALDLFVETLPLSETSNYAKRVLESVYLYEISYAGRGNFPDLTGTAAPPRIPPPDF
jgi:soluble lytic murein transglycosylase-like protein